ncbi:branched-chain amino acid ABC transporter permease [Achromobacter aloeverae]|uniref:Branched-chain amino acid ABC transporter permease n=1 Tax=Achromobacter aloeverae TaxID=1750518 RepID=A0A4Q1HP09_9BURK|nr:branched-chain amino acid ABC transporter permease [Achromobacter aloeverae]RXN92782.1 branched-chain amino acid ABC transporter permease [Achromobacter aloeverae]
MFTLPILSQVFINGLSLSAIYILVALGFTLLFGIMRVVNFAHGAFAMLGGYALFYLYGVYKLPYPIAILGGSMLVAALSLVLERLVFRWFYHKMFQSMIALLGLNLALVYTAVLAWDVNERSLPSVSDSVIDIAGIQVPADRLVIIGMAVVVLGLFWLFVTRTRQGLAMRAAALDPEIAATQGINTRGIYMLAFVIAVFMTALAGGLYAQTYALSPFMGDRPLMVAFIVVILGGMGSVPGAALGGLLLGFTESFLSTFYGASISSFVSFGVVIALLVLRPWGLLGKPE